MVVCGGAATPAAAALGPVANLSGCRRFLASGTGPMYPRGMRVRSGQPIARRAAFVVAAGIIVMAGMANAAPRAGVWDLQLGASLDQMPPVLAFQAYACGSNGGPPGTVLGGWDEYRRCAPEADGLREVYFEYDDEAEYVARAREDFAAGWLAGTAYESFPIIASALFDEHGTLAGLRIVTDPRAEQRNDPFLHLRPRQEHYLLAGYLLEKFGIDSSYCEDLTPGPEERPVLGMFAKQHCSAVVEGVRYDINAVLLRRAGETDIDPATGRLTAGDFLSETRAELRLVRAAPR